MSKWIKETRPNYCRLLSIRNTFLIQGHTRVESKWVEKDVSNSCNGKQRQKKKETSRPERTSHNDKKVSS